MATWNGSFPEDSNYSANYSTPRNASTEDNWTYFNENLAYPRNDSARSYYPRTDGRAYKQNGPVDAFYQHPSNMVPIESPRVKLIGPSLSSATNYLQTSNNSANGIASVSRSAPFFRDNHKPKSKENRTINKAILESDIGQSSLVQNSNLRDTPNEFVPNRLNKDRFNERNDYNNASRSSFDAQDFRSKSINKYTSLSDNRYKNERRYDTRRDINYRQKNSQDAQIPSRPKYKNTHRSGNNVRNCNKFQNGKYYNRRHQSDASYVEQYAGATTPTTEFSGSLTFNSQENKTSVKEFQESDSSSDVGRSKEETYENNDSEKNDSLKTLGMQQNNKPKQFNNYANTANYSKYKHYKYNSNDVQSESGGIHKIAVATQYTRNNEITANHKEKNLENWRDRAEDNEVARVQEKNIKKKNKIDDASQRDRLTEQLNRGILDCLICYEHIKQDEYIWSCSNCYHVLHLKCIKEWAKSSMSNERSWKCPACRDISFLIPDDCFCFCGKRKMPEWNRRDVAHSCGEICDRNLSKNNCTHKCTLLCHPGSCPQCMAMVSKYCACGRMSQKLPCSAPHLLVQLQCISICNKKLSCGKHTCRRKCHWGECGLCNETVQLTCFCGKKTKEIPCRGYVIDKYSCNNICNKLLNCKKHYCQKVCHLEACESCSLIIRIYRQTPLTRKRENCFEPMDQISSKCFSCGQHGFCSPFYKTPYNKCPICSVHTDVKCQSGNMDRNIAHKDLTKSITDAVCKKLTNCNSFMLICACVCVYTFRMMKKM